MRVKLQPPPNYKPLPAVVSETTAKFRWPIANPPEPYSPPKSHISVDGPLQPPPPKPRLKYHRQSSYTDAYVTFPTKYEKPKKPESEWNEPIGKIGELVEESMYEKDFEWPGQTAKAEKLPPLISTLGLGILPIVEKERTKIKIFPEKEFKESVCGEDGKESTSSASSTRLSYWELNCNPHKPVERIWEEQTTHRIDYVVPPKTRGPTKKETPPAEESHLYFIGPGRMETVSTYMRDYD
ncbi:hypothetical protein JTE90_009443 [Oedothorax gibbosus]|uniref:Uncharacterized protein n=1 Tax=Oedothorax gibbosus TaxID=931172 RepID=A0AAV6VUZ5_9ARAC|nr:hypothetical protein JTE90_009443 [Oedothorax gibbosus]